jgi:erythronate-4-phosphate dehydrogenase
MKIVADKDIPFIENYFGSMGELILKPGRSIAQEDLVSADMLLVRSVTAVTRELLQGTSVKFVGSPTTGQDHLDTKWLSQAGIKWYVAEGCNTVAVVEYVVCVIAALQKNDYLPQQSLRAGVIGVGKIGSQVVEKLKILGFDVIQHDPLRAANEPDFHSTPLEDFHDLDVVTVHTSLHEGDYSTYHLINKHFLQKQKKNCILLNTARGAVVDGTDLKHYGQHLYWSLDVWEDEPFIDMSAVELALIATPHIAGYSVQSKQRGIDMVYRAACETLSITPLLSAMTFPYKAISLENATVDWRDVVLKIFDPMSTSQKMHEALTKEDIGVAFDKLRKHFIERAEFTYVQLEQYKVSEADALLLNALGCKVN